MSDTQKGATREDVARVIKQWLSRPSTPVRFTTIIAYDAVETFLGTQLDTQSKRWCSAALEKLTKGGWLTREKGDRTFLIVQRPTPTAEKLQALEVEVERRGIPQPTRWEEIPRIDRLTLFDRFLEAFWLTVKEGSYLALGGGVFAAKASAIYARTSNLVNAQAVDPRAIQIELSDARTFGLYFIGRDTSTICWRASSVLLLSRYVGQQETIRLRNKILTLARVSRKESSDEARKAEALTD